QMRPSNKILRSNSSKAI
ncbi:kinase domain protein, partial [Vibrio parahaemolyticus V-223/04]